MIIIKKIVISMYQDGALIGYLNSEFPLLFNSKQRTPDLRLKFILVIARINE